MSREMKMDDGGAGEKGGGTNAAVYIITLNILVTYDQDSNEPSHVKSFCSQGMYWIYI